jgi:hypothetical protein
VARWSESGFVVAVGETPPAPPAPTLRVVRARSGRIDLFAHVARAGRCAVRVVDVRGRTVATLLDAHVPAGDVPITWDARRIRRGVYRATCTTTGGDAACPVLVAP